jgi:hypothetical protein
MSNKKNYYNKLGFYSYSILKKYESSPLEALNMMRSGYGNDDNDKYVYNENFLLGDAIEAAYTKKKVPTYLNSIKPQDYSAAKGFLEFIKAHSISNKEAVIFEDTFSEQQKRDLFIFITEDLKLFGSIKKIDTFIRKMKDLRSIIRNLMNGKILIDTKYRNIIGSITTLNSKNKLPLKSNKLIFENKNIKILTDVMVLSKDNDKILLDMIAYDKSDNTLYLFDIKSSINTPNKFKYDFIKYKYYLQSSFYKNIVINKIKDTEIEHLNSLLLTGNDASNIETSINIPINVKVLNFRFILISKISGQSPVIFRVNKELHEIGLNGGEDEYGNRIYGALELKEKMKDGIRDNNFNNHEYYNIDDRADLDLNVFKSYKPISITKENNKNSEEDNPDITF